MAFLHFKDYYGTVLAHIITSQLAEDSGIRLTPTPKDKWKGGIIGTITFRDNTILEVYEYVKIGQHFGSVDRTFYRFKYNWSNGEYFRYEMDTKASRDDNNNPRPDHPEFHLHAITERPRYITHKTSFFEIYDFVAASCYQKAR